MYSLTRSSRLPPECPTWSALGTTRETGLTRGRSDVRRGGGGGGGVEACMSTGLRAWVWDYECHVYIMCVYIAIYTA